MICINLTAKHRWLFAVLFALSLGLKAQSPALSPQKLADLNQELEAMKSLMSDTLVNAEGNAMSLIYFWVSQQEKRIDSLKNVTVVLDQELKQLPQPEPVDTSAVTRVYILLDSMRTVEQNLAQPAN